MKLQISEKAHVDLTAIWRYNAEYYGIAHADNYEQFIKEKMQILTGDPNRGKPVEDFPRLRSLLIKRRARGHGHIAFYEIHGDTIYVVRVLHTAMNTADHLGNPVQ